IISSKTWLYDLFMDQEWLDTLHMEVGMFYLEVKGFNYKLTQTYSTVTPFFLECLKRHQDDIDKKIKTKEDVGSVSNLTAEVFGFARKCAFPWARSDFVYMPLNIGGHWVLLVLAVESKI
ncbi:unnamed protein product, partial [Cuscuta campestris]